MPSYLIKILIGWELMVEPLYLWSTVPLENPLKLKSFIHREKIHINYLISKYEWGSSIYPMQVQFPPVSNTLVWFPEHLHEWSECRARIKPWAPLRVALKQILYTHIYLFIYKINSKMQKYLNPGLSFWAYFESFIIKDFCIIINAKLKRLLSFI